LEEEQRALARDAKSQATRDIHLEFAERYRQQAEHIELKEADDATSSSPGSDPDF
jgi:hypothetical protein